jgi:hypothetical protein
MTMTRAYILKSSLVFSLSRVTVQLGQRFYKLSLTPKMVEEIANNAIADMRKRGGWDELDEEGGPGANSGPR